MAKKFLLGLLLLGCFSCSHNEKSKIQSLESFVQDLFSEKYRYYVLYDAEEAQRSWNRLASFYLNEKGLNDAMGELVREKENLMRTELRYISSSVTTRILPKSIKRIGNETEFVVRIIHELTSETKSTSGNFIVTKGSTPVLITVLEEEGFIVKKETFVNEAKGETVGLE